MTSCHKEGARDRNRSAGSSRGIGSFDCSPIPVANT
eukprot:gene10497-biopygen15609